MKPSLTSARFNLREIAKQLILLQDHLTEEEKFCVDCIRKHLMTIEALAEEAISMDPKSSHIRDCRELAKQAKKWMVDFSSGIDPGVISIYVRTARKKLVAKVYDPRE